jgi:hypothetical protein
MPGTPRRTTAARKKGHRAASEGQRGCRRGNPGIERCRARLGGAASLDDDAPITCQFMLEDHAVRHSYRHLALIRAALKK